MISREEPDLTASVEDAFDDAMELMGEKRASSKTKGVLQVTRLMQSKFVRDQVEKNSLTMRTLLRGFLSHSDMKLATLSCHALGLVGLTLGADSDDVFDDCHNALRTIAQDPSRKARVRAKCARCLALLAFLGCDDPFAQAQARNALRPLFRAKEPQVAQSALAGWTLLASTMRTYDLAVPVFENVGAAMLQLLEHKSIDVKMAAGRALGLIFGARSEYDGDQDQDSDDEKKGATTAETKATSARQALAGRIRDAIKGLATVSTKSIAKKERAIHHAVFRDILHTVEDGDVPSETLVIAKNKIEIAGWAKRVQLYEIKAWLRSGLQRHFKENSILSQIFGFEIREISRDEAVRDRDELIYQHKIRERAQRVKNAKARRLKTRSAVGGEEDAVY